MRAAGVCLRAASEPNAGEKAAAEPRSTRLTTLRSMCRRRSELWRSESEDERRRPPDAIRMEKVCQFDKDQLY